MIKVHKSRPLKTIEENKTKKNIKTINIKTKEIISNKDLAKLVSDNKVKNYVLVKPKKIEPYVKSKPNKLKIDNLDPKINLRIPLKTKKK